MEMADCSKDGTPLLEEMDPMHMHLTIDGPAIRAARTAEKKKGEVESRVPMEPMSESEGRKRADEPDDAGHNGKSQPRSANRVAVKSGPPRTWYPREMKELPMALGAAHPRQTTGSGSRTRTPQEKTAEFKTRDPISQVGSYAVETLSASRVHVWNILIIDERVHIWFYDRQGSIQSYGLDNIKNLPHFFVLLALQRLDLEGSGFAPNLSFDTDNDWSAQLDLTLHKPAGNLEPQVQQPAARVKFRLDWGVPQWGLVRRATTVYEFDLTNHPAMEHVVKLSWPKVSRTPEPEILKELGEIPEEGVKGHIPVLLTSLIPTMVDTYLIRKRLGTSPQAHFSESQAPRRPAITEFRRLVPVWDLTPDGFFDVWMQCLSCHIILWEKGFHHRDISPENMMYYYDGNSVVGVLNDWGLTTIIPSLGTFNTDRTSTIPFMALQLLSGKSVVHKPRHDAESFIWLFLWVCGCSDGSKREVLVAPYKAWRKLDMTACKRARRAFLCGTSLEDINVSEHHAPNALFCLFLAWLLQQLSLHIWNFSPTSAHRNTQEQKDMALFKALLPEFREVRDNLNKKFSPKDWSDDGLRPTIRKYIYNAVNSIILSALDTY